MPSAHSHGVEVPPGKQQGTPGDTAFIVQRQRWVAQPEQAVLQSNKKLITHGPSQGHVVG